MTVSVTNITVHLKLMNDYREIRGDLKSRVFSGALPKRSREAGLPEQDFEERAGQFVVTIWRDWLTAEVLAEYHLSERKLSAIKFLKTHGKITNTEYQQKFSVAKRTATLDLSELVVAGLIEKTGKTGKGVYYRLAKGATTQIP